MLSSSLNSEKPKPSRKRKICADQWKQNERKKKRQHGKEYITSNGIPREAKTIRPPCKPECALIVQTIFPKICEKKYLKLIGHWMIVRNAHFILNSSQGG